MNTVHGDDRLNVYFNFFKKRKNYPTLRSVIKEIPQPKMDQKPVFDYDTTGLNKFTSDSLLRLDNYRNPNKKNPFKKPLCCEVNYKPTFPRNINFVNSSCFYLNMEDEFQVVMDQPTETQNFTSWEVFETFLDLLIFLIGFIH